MCGRCWKKWELVNYWILGAMSRAGPALARTAQTGRRDPAAKRGVPFRPCPLNLTGHLTKAFQSIGC